MSIPNRANTPFVQRSLRRDSLLPPFVARYGVAFACVIVAVLIKVALGAFVNADLANSAPFITLWSAVIISAWYGGVGAGLWATLLALIAANYFFYPPFGFNLPNQTQAINQILFALGGVLVSFLSYARLRALNALRLERNRFAVTLSSIGDAVIATDAEGTVTFLNPVAEALTGWHEVGSSLTDVFPIVNEQTRAPVDNPVNKVLQTGAIVGLANHTILLSRDGREIPIDDSAAPIREGNGTPQGAILVFRDITERKKAEDARDALLAREQVARRALEEADELKDRFLSVASHELRTPLTSIKGYGQILRRRYDKGTLRTDDSYIGQILDTLDGQVNRMTRLIAEMLDISRIRTGHMALTYTSDVDVLALVNEVIGQQQQAEYSDHPLSVQTDETDLTATIDRDRVAQVLNNLISNARKYSPAGAPIRISIISGAADSFTLAVRDEGYGIAEADQSRIFGQFYRAQNPDIQRMEGLGLGLFISADIVARHGGTVRVESAPGAGSTFFITLPLQPQSAEHAEP